MADTRVQHQVEDWVREEWMPRHFGQRFRQERVALTSGGVFEFDAVSADNAVVATISTSGATTSSRKRGAGKLNKIRSDMLFLMLADAQRRIVVLTERDMLDLCMKEREAGRVPPGIEFVQASVPHGLAAKLKEARNVASREVSPSKHESARG